MLVIFKIGTGACRDVSRTGSGVEARELEKVNIGADEVAVQAVGADLRVGRVGASCELSRGGESASGEGSDSEELHFDGGKWWSVLKRRSDVYKT